MTIPERPGAFLEFCRVIGERSVTEFNYRLAGRDEAHIFVGIEVSGPEEAAGIRATLAAHGYACTDSSDNDVAKTHVRHMVGGRRADVADEVLFSFEFPERPGALMQFLSTPRRALEHLAVPLPNHGAAFGRVLCGFEVSSAERPVLAAALEAPRLRGRRRDGERRGALLPAMRSRRRRHRVAGIGRASRPPEVAVTRSPPRPARDATSAATVKLTAPPSASTCRTHDASAWIDRAGTSSR